MKCENCTKYDDCRTGSGLTWPCGAYRPKTGGGMDIEKLIEQLRTESLYADKASLEIMDLCMDAATALSTLQAENEKLRAEVESFKKEHCAGCSIPAVKAEQIRDLTDAPKLRAELEQVTRDFDGICKYIDSEGFLRKQFCENGNSDLEPCICPSLKEHPGYIDSDDCEGCDYFCNSWRSQKED